MSGRETSWKTRLLLEEVLVRLISDSDVTLTDRWLNVWCIWYTYLETLQECQSRCRIGWIIQDFWDMCVSRSLIFRLETKMPWRQTPSRKKKAVVFTTVMTSAYQDQLNAGFSKVCEIFKVCGIESWKYVREFHTLVATFPCPKTWCWTKLLLVVWHVGQTTSWAQALAIESYHRFQTYSRQSEGLATRDLVRPAGGAHPVVCVGPNAPV